MYIGTLKNKGVVEFLKKKRGFFYPALMKNEIKCNGLAGMPIYGLPNLAVHFWPSLSAGCDRTMGFFIVHY